MPNFFMGTNLAEIGSIKLKSNVTFRIIVFTIIKIALFGFWWLAHGLGDHLRSFSRVCSKIFTIFKCRERNKVAVFVKMLQIFKSSQKFRCSAYSYGEKIFKNNKNQFSTAVIWFKKKYFWLKLSFFWYFHPNYAK